MNANVSEKLNRFIDLLENIFELDKADLDFGIYRIINIRKEMIHEFLSESLPKKVQEALAPFATDTSTITARIGEIEKQAAGLEIEVTASPKLAEEYAKLKNELAVGTDLTALESDVYSALYSFFNRYYDEGDFISKRRYKEGVYAIPYEGEEVKLHWANADQYYIKTAENFKDYTFISDGKKVHFKLVDASTEKNNNKEADSSKRIFMLYSEAKEKPEIKTFAEIDGELFIHFIYDVPADKRTAKQYAEANLATITETIQNSFKTWNHVLAKASLAKDEKRTLLEKHLNAYVAKNTFDYFIHKDLHGFLSRELNFFIKSEVIHLDDLDTTDEKRADSFLAKVRAIKRVGKVIIDFLAQIENFQKKLWLKKKFVVDTNWCITLDRIDERFYSEIIANNAQIAEWKEMYAIDEIAGDSTTKAYSDPLSLNFLKQNNNLLVDTRHFSTDFKERLIASIDNLDEETGGLLIHSENFQALNLMQEKYRGEIDCVHIDPPYNTDTSGFLYKNNYRHSSWLSMMDARISAGAELLNNKGSFVCHIDENEYERLWALFELKPFVRTGTIVWDKRNPMTGGGGIATQHEYIIWRDKCEKTIVLNSNHAQLMLDKVKSLMAYHNQNMELVRKDYVFWLNDQDDFSNGEKANRYIDDKGNIYQSVSLRAPELRDDPKFHIPLIHPITKKPCPVPPNGFSRTPETLAKMIERGEILFGKDETTQPRQKSILKPDKSMQLTSLIQDATRGKSDLRKLSLDFPYNHSATFYELLVSSAADSRGTILDYFAGSGTTGHAVLNLNREDNGNRKYILVEMGEYFHTVTLPRMKKVIYAADWKGGKPQNRNSGLSHIMKYMALESYEDTLSNIELDNKKNELVLNKFGDNYLLHYMLNYEAQESLLNLDAFSNPFNYELKINENNETKNKTIDICETFNFLIGLSVKSQSATTYFSAKPDPKGEYEGAAKLERDNNGVYGFKQIEGTSPDGRRILIIWRTITEDILQSNAALDAYFCKNRINPEDREFDLIYVNGDNNLENLRLDEETWKVQRIEPVFKDKMFAES